jgi:hypothetical protein
MANSTDYILDWRIRGIPSDVWVRFSDAIGQLVQKEKLTAVDARYLTTPNQANLAFAGHTAKVLAEPTTRGKAIANVTEIYDIRGGMKAAHVHYKGAVYMLNETQWKRFTALVVNDFRAKLDSAGAIGFDQVMDISEVAASLG